MKSLLGGISQKGLANLDHKGLANLDIEQIGCCNKISGARCSSALDVILLAGLASSFFAGGQGVDAKATSKASRF